jgi:hypothetical protein
LSTSIAIDGVVLQLEFLKYGANSLALDIDDLFNDVVCLGFLFSSSQHTIQSISKIE